MQLAYDIAATYAENFERGPQLDAVPTVPQTSPRPFLGRAVNSPLGVAAGLLPNAKWIGAYAARGWDLLTYKTVRSVARDCYPVPNWVFVDADAGEGPVVATETFPADPAAVSSAVCFGMPSRVPALWREDIARAKARWCRGNC